MTNNRILLTFIFSSILISCRFLSYKSYSKDLSISFGSGGGFTGEINEYILEGNGNLFLHKSLSNDTILLKNIEYKNIKNILKLSESNEIQLSNLKETGNMTNFIKIYKNGNQLKAISWPQEKTDLDLPIKVLNSKLYSLLIPTE